MHCARNRRQVAEFFFKKLLPRHAINETLKKKTGPAKSDNVYGFNEIGRAVKTLSDSRE